MVSTDVVTPALFLSIPIPCLALLSYDWRFHRTTPLKSAFFILIAILSAMAGGTGLSGVIGSCELLRMVAKAFANLLECALSGISLFALLSFSRHPALSQRVLRFFLALTAFLLTCELVTALVPESPPLLPPILALASRGIMLSLALITATCSCSRDAAIQAEVDTEKGRPAQGSSPGKTAVRVSSPTPGTWPFPASLAPRSQRNSRNCSARSKVTVTNLPRSLTFTPMGDCEKGNDHHNVDPAQIVGVFLAVLAAAQTASIVCATLSVACSVVTGRSITDANTFLPRIIIARAICTFLWIIAVLTVIHFAPADIRSNISDAAKESVADREPDKFGCGIPAPRTLTHFGSSDSTPDFLSLRDPFASPPPPPPPPPFPPVGLGLDEVDVGWNGNKEIGVQYRFPAPRSIVNGKGRGKGKKVRPGGRKHLVHQGSTRALLPLPPLPTTRRTEVDADKEKGFGDEARLAQLLLQSLSEGAGECESPHTPTLPTVPLPQAAHMQLCSRWSTSTTVRSTMTASISNKSGVSTYTSYASEKIRASRVSMNTVASGLGSRKSSEARRKSGAPTASSSKD
ncbi:hypothetical protein PAXINDRAFT_8840 [Paxillus involutus ATCC 200175]|nr:hypothetical protein PAXINDRAFT_8840 [Paxillus involutus ATCC 200175]